MIQISYRQKLLSTSAEYILQSTIGWRKPLDQANYQLIVPKNIEIINFSIIPDNSVDYTTEMVYFWEKYNYLPPKNFTFEFLY